MKENTITHVICPYCCHKFPPSEADFRLNEPCIITEQTTGTGGKKTKKKPTSRSVNYGKENDEKLYAYNSNVLRNPQKTSQKNAMQYMAVSITDENVAVDEEMKYGFPQKVVYTAEDGKEYATQTRLCPNCHNTLPIGYGLRETILISIIGDARAGKSVYLTMLINALENNEDFSSKLNFIGDKDIKQNIFESYQKPLLQENILVDSTKRKKIPPFAYNYWYQYRDKDGSWAENTIDLIFYDIAGEDLRDDSAIRQNGFNIVDSSGLIFLIDPTNFGTMKDLFAIRDRALIDAVPKDNSVQNIFSAMFNYFLGMDKEKSHIPVALAVSKADLFGFAELSFFDNKPENRIQNTLENENYEGYVHMPSARGLHTEVRELLQHLNEDLILNNASGCFKYINCFAVSSLGKKPIIEQLTDPKTNKPIKKGRVDGELQPFRIKEPFYWILFKNGLLNRYEDDGAYYANGELTLAAERASRALNSGQAGFDIIAFIKKLFGIAPKED